MSATSDRTMDCSGPYDLRGSKRKLVSAFDQGEGPTYDVGKEQYLLETTGKQGGNN